MFIYICGRSETHVPPQQYQDDAEKIIAFVFYYVHFGRFCGLRIFSTWLPTNSRRLIDCKSVMGATGSGKSTVRLFRFGCALPRVLTPFLPLAPP
jgi:hypothetical protein